jgi:hypothetical protein
MNQKWIDKAVTLVLSPKGFNGHDYDEMKRRYRFIDFAGIALINAMGGNNLAKTKAEFRDHEVAIRRLVKEHFKKEEGRRKHRRVSS